MQRTKSRFVQPLTHAFYFHATAAPDSIHFFPYMTPEQSEIILMEETLKGGNKQTQHLPCS